MKFLKYPAAMLTCSFIMGLVMLVLFGLVGGYFGSGFGLIAGLFIALEMDEIMLIWQSPKIYYHAGLFLRVRSKRYRLIKVGLN